MLCVSFRVCRINVVVLCVRFFGSQLQRACECVCACERGFLCSCMSLILNSINFVLCVGVRVLLCGARVCFCVF